MPKGKYSFDLKKEDGTLYSLAEYQKYEKEHAREYELDKAAGFGGGLSLEECRKIYINLTEHGFKDWYDWACANWGTKWNACDPTEFEKMDDGRISIQFDTAWSVPWPIVEKLSLLFPNIVLLVSAAHEEGVAEHSKWQNGLELSYTKKDYLCEALDACDEEDS